jgi:hypothetical protein
MRGAGVFLNKYIAFLGLVILITSTLAACTLNRPPAIITFNVNPTDIALGESTILEWYVTNADIITIDQGIGNVSAYGTLSVSPSLSVTYTLTAANSGGEVTKSIDVIVDGDSFSPISPPDDFITCDEVENYIGEVKTVEGVVKTAVYMELSRGQPTLLYLCKPDSYFPQVTLVIRKDDREKFRQKFPPNPESYFIYKTVRAKGLIQKQTGFIQIELEHPSNIWVVE